jgi:hypothetical protein
LRAAEDEKPDGDQEGVGGENDRGTRGRIGQERGWGEGHLEGPELGIHLETDASGQVWGLKNVPYVDANAVHLALPVMWERHDAERERLNREKPPGWEERMKALDADAERMSRMREQADELADSGRGGARVRNLFYHDAAGAEPAWTNRARAESLDTDPERTRERYARLKKIIGRIDEVMRANQKIINEAEDFLLGANAEFDARASCAGFLKNVNEALALRKEALNAELVRSEYLRRPENLDLRGLRFRREIQNAKSLMEAKRAEIGAFGRKSEAKPHLRQELETHEGAAVNAQKELDEWMSDPLREQAMRARAEDLTERESEILDEIAELERMIGGSEEMMAHAQERTDDLVSLFHDQMQYLIRERAKADRERTDAFLAMTAMR